jgi:CO/xanthine dehydrogenase FAD-binding subunit
MTLPRFEYLVPKTLQEACSLLLLYQGGARVMTGGTDLLPKMKDRILNPQYLIGLRNIPGLDYVKHDKDVGLRIGGLATLAQVAESPEVIKRFPMLSEAIPQMASAQVRNIGTVAGNICNASPSADTVPSLIVMGAKVKLLDAVGLSRTLALEEFFAGPGKTALAEGELLEEIQVPDVPARSGGAYWKLSLRRAMDLATVGVACFLTLDKSQVCRDVKIALGAVGPTPIRAKEAEAAVRGASLNKDVLEKAAVAAVAASKPITDIRGSAEYRRKMVGELTRRVISMAWEKASASR